jgi:hypothetical protein
MVAPFATPDDLAEFLQTATQAEADAGDPNVLDTTIALRALQAATDDIVAICGWSITAETGVSITVDPRQRVQLPTLYLTNVQSVTNQFGHVVATALYYWEEWGEIHFWGGWWGDRTVINTAEYPVYGHDRLTIVFDHGFPTVPAVVRNVCLEQAAESVVNPLKLASFSRVGVQDIHRLRADVGNPLDVDERLNAYRLAAL